MAATATSTRVHRVETDISSRQSAVERSYPIFTALLAFACIVTSSCIAAGVNNMAKAVETVGSGVEEAAGSGITLTSKVTVLQLNATSGMQEWAETSFGLLTTVSTKLGTLRTKTLEAASEYDAAVSASNTAAQTAAVTALADHYDAFFDGSLVQVEQQLAAYGSRQALAAALSSNLTVSSGVASKLNTLSYIADQLSNIGQIMDAAVAIRERHCSQSGDCNSTAPAALLTLADALQAASDFVGAVDDLVAAIRAAIAGVRDTVPNGLRHSSSAAQQACAAIAACHDETRGFVEQVSTAQQAATTTAGKVGNALNTSIVSLLDQAREKVEGVVRRKDDVLGFIQGKITITTTSLTSYEVSLRAMQTAANEAPPKVARNIRGFGIAVAVYGIVVSLGTLLYALALQKMCFASLDVDKIKQSCLRNVVYTIMYLAVDVFVLVSFLAMLAVAVLGGLESLLVSACYGVRTDDAADGRAETCKSVNGSMSSSLLLTLGAGVLNFVLSYHILVALQASYSKYVASGLNSNQGEGVDLDFNGDGQQNSKGFDTTGDGKIDTVLQNNVKRPSVPSGTKRVI